MARKIVSPPPGMAGGSFLKLIYRIENPSQIADNTILGRNRRVAEVLCYLSRMRAADLLSKTAAITTSGATVQSYRATAEPDIPGLPLAQQAMAHFLPCQILIDDQEPWEYLSDDLTMQRLRWLFAEGRHVPVNFNKADSQAESSGLIEAFRVSCKNVVEDNAPRADPRVNTSLVQQTYIGTWKPLAVQAYGDAQTAKGEKPQPPAIQYAAEGHNVITNLAERGGASSYQWNIDETVSILRTCQAKMRASPLPGILQANSMDLGILERDFKP